MKSSTISLRMVTVTMTVALAVAAGCQDAEPEDAGTSVEPDTVRLYWQAPDENSGQLVLHHKDITAKEKAQLFAARDQQRLAAGSVDPSVAKVARANTISSTDWASACGWWDWFLVSSAANRGGDIFCGHFSDDVHTNASVTIPFVPRYYETSDRNWGFLCTGEFSCGCSFGCGPSNWGLNVWSAFPPGMFTGNINPPSNVTVMIVGFPFPP
jgi:hypothetical protein